MTSTIGDTITNPVTGNQEIVKQVIKDSNGNPIDVFTDENNLITIYPTVGGTYVLALTSTSTPITYKIVSTGTNSSSGLVDSYDVAVQTVVGTMTVVGTTTTTVNFSTTETGSSIPNTPTPGASSVTPGLNPTGPVNVVNVGQGGSSGSNAYGFEIFGVQFGFSGSDGDPGSAAPVTGTLTVSAARGPINSTADVTNGINYGSVGGQGGTGGTSYGNIGPYNGGNGGAGGDADLVNNAQVTTSGTLSNGIFVFSRSGKGGKGGDGILFSTGGTGGGTGTGGTVSIDNNGSIGTTGPMANGIYGLSSGGSGGDGGGSYGIIGGGGSGAGAGDGGLVYITNTGSITTTGNGSNGIFAQSIGGTGGNGGDAVGIVAFGGNASAGGTGSDVSVVNFGHISTTGTNSNGIFGQSIGGGGGDSGSAVSIATLGGVGGLGNDAGKVTLTNSLGGLIQTTGDDSSGLFGQSIGGGGGNTAVVVGIVASGSNTPTPIALGANATGANTTAGEGNTVTLTNDGTISTSGNGSRGIFGQSIGGGGGNAGASLGLVSIGGSGSSGGNGATVTISNSSTGSVFTSGTGSDAIFGQSIGGGGGTGGASGGLSALGGSGAAAGVGGTVTISNSGFLHTTGVDSRGIIAQSIGGGGGSGGSGGGLIALGGAGSAAGAAGDVFVSNTGLIITTGKESTGVFAQSVGGGGGDGGSSAGLFTIGGQADSGGAAGTVDVTQGGDITTSGDGALGLFVQSIGGGGGNGGDADSASAFVGLAIGGSAANGGPGGDVNITLEEKTVQISPTSSVLAPSLISTTGAGSTGILAQSVGGGGGNGGHAIQTTVGFGAAISIAVGGDGGKGGAGGTVTLGSSSNPGDGDVTTSGANSVGVLLESVGGGGGNGGTTVAASASVSPGVSVSSSVAVGGQAGDGGVGGNVSADLTSVINTGGDFSTGFIAQSVGGGGGNGGNAIAATASFAVAGAVASGVAVGGKGATGGAGGEVNVTLDGSVTTTGDQSGGILLQSVGGGGGNGGMAISVAAAAAGGGAGDLTVGLGGAGLGGGAGGDVNANISDNISTKGDNATGAIIQSIGGGGGNSGLTVSAGVAGAGVAAGGVNIAIGATSGSGGAGGIVDASYAGNITTAGNHSTGLLVQSVGGGGGNSGGTIAASLDGAAGAAGGVSVGIGGDGGAAANGGTNATLNGTLVTSVTLVTTSGTITTGGNYSTGIVVQSVGGGGGNGGYDIAATGAGGLTASGAVSIGMGGDGGAAGDGEKVLATLASDVSTGGNNSDGILVQSVGGGGGNGGDNVSAGLSIAGGASGAVTVGLGGDGAGGGAGGEVDASSSGQITTSGTNSSAFVVQSVGGGGGNGGFDISADLSIGGDASGGVSVGLGGDGDKGGSAGAVVASSSGDITTKGGNSVGILAQSVGGGGGNGGYNVSVAASGSGEASGAVSVGLGGTGAGGGNGSTVQLTVNNNVTTSGVNSVGIEAQSVGGGGGNGGFDVSVAASAAGDASGAVGVGLGGSAGGGGSASTVISNVTGSITTGGANSTGLLVQSVGGGGGNGGYNVSATLNVSGGVGGAASIGIGGSGGSGGNGGIVSSTEDGDVSTAGANSAGVIAQSLGGGGGNGGLNVSGAISATNGLGGGVSIGIGGSGGGGGNGSTVGSSVDGNVTTKGADSIGVLAQSLGGGGGNGGIDVSGVISISNDGSGAAVSVGLGGSGGTGGTGGDVTSTVTGNISTSGNDSAGVVAQSLGGGGGSGGINISGDVNVSNAAGGTVGIGLGGSGGGGGKAGSVTSTVTGTIVDGVKEGVSTAGTDSTAILAQSVGGGGGKGALNVTGGISYTAGTGGSVSIGVGGSGGGGGTGGDVELTVSEAGTITTTGTNSNGIMAQSVGGGGGNGGVDVAGSIDIADEPGATSASATIGVGGFGGDGGSSGTVTLNYSGPTVNVKDGSGVVAQSVGGGGGDGGVNVSGAISYGVGTGSNGYGLVVGVGGYGGGGGSASDVTVTITGGGQITAGGAGEIAPTNGESGIFAQSVGGGGGNGGINVSGAIAGTSPLLVGVGGNGGSAGIGGNVTVTGTTDVTIADPTSATSFTSAGVFAQSIGGGGGDGGLNVSGAFAISKAAGITKPSITLGIGGSGGSGAVSGTVTVDMTGDIAASGYRVDGILAQSIAGGGGNGGINVSAAGSLSEEGDSGGPTDLSVVGGVGGNGGAGADAGEVYVTDTGSISTTNDNSRGVLAQSIGGGGGTGGMNITGNFAQGSSPISIGVGGSGEIGGDGSTVTVDRGSITQDAGAITTNGDTAHGIEAQSLGGGGGDAGMNFIVGLTLVGSDESDSGGSAQFAIGGSGAGAGNGGDVFVNNYSSITTTGANSDGILAQSIGGGGGNGTLNLAVTYAGKSSDNMGVNVAVGGATGDGGTGGTVNVVSVGNISTSGANSYGILAQSIGGGGGNAGMDLAYSKTDGGKVGVTIGAHGGTGGFGSDVSLTSTGTVTTQGNGAYGLFAQSLGNGGGNSSTTSVSAEGATEEGQDPPGSASVAIGLEGGSGGYAGDVSIISAGTVSTAGDSTYAIVAQSIGGGGGNGGSAITTSLNSPTVGVSVGGTGGTGGAGGVVDIFNTAMVSTTGAGSIGIFAQSVGGGGGTGGLSTAGGLGFKSGSSATVAVGGSGGDGMTSDNVTVNNFGNITTTGSNTSGGGADGILAQSIGGGGGTSGMVITTKLGAVTQSATTLSLSIGGAGGTGAMSGTVNVSNVGGDISTSGGDANGIFAQSVGGGGGIAADIFNGQIASTGGKGSGTMNIGGTGGDGGQSGDVFVSNLIGAETINGTITSVSGTISTKGDGANGILAMSIGGKGGVGSTVINAQGVNNDTDPSTSFSASIGGFGGDGARGGNVDVQNDGSIYTSGAQADGIVALSIGGGGGNGGASISGNLALGFENKNSTAINLALGGSGGNGNYAGNVVVNNTGLISTSGNQSDGIFAESVGGGGGNGGLAVSLSNNIISNPKTNPANFLSNVALGGFGGDGGDSGNVTVTNSGTIVVSGNNSYGIYAQSVSGGGGNTGYSLSAPAWMLAADTFSYFLGGGATGTAGSVNVSSTGTIVTTGQNDLAMFSQSVNGGGGYINTYLNASQQAVALDPDGNALPGNENLLGKVTAAVNSVVSVGSNWIEGAAATVEDGIEGLIPGLSTPPPTPRPDPSNAGGVIAATTSGDTYTMGDKSAAGVTQTIGGGGGTVMSDVVVDPLGLVNNEFNLGETGTTTHTGDNGGDVVANHSGVTATFGNDSAGNILQTIGGGGGTVMTSVEVVPDSTGSVTPQFTSFALESPTPAITGTATLGADGGMASSGGTVTMGNLGETYTTGDRSFGLLVQSIGGGGGFVDATGYDVLQVTLGGTNATSGNGGDITMTNTGAITTLGARADGVILQSIGGGGGLVLSDLDPSAVNYSLSATNSGNGGNINFTQIGDVIVTGDDSIGILAQSIGGGGGDVDRDYLGTAGGAGTSGTINLTITGTVAAIGANGIAVFAQSQGRDGEGDISISLAAGKTILGGISNGVGVQISGGTNNSFTNNGIVEELDANGVAILADTGNDTVNNYGTVIGSANLGAGQNTFNNEVGSVLESGNYINLSSSGTFTNAGIIAEGGIGTIQVTALTGNYVQTGNAVWYNDISPTFANDQLNISGDANLGNYTNTVNLNQVTGVANTSGSYTLITSATDLVGSFQFGTMTGFTMPNGLTYTFEYTDPAELLLLQPSKGPFYWDGAISPVWNTDFVDGITNWSTDATGTSYIYGTPGIGSDVYFASSLSSTINLVTMGEDYTVNSLTVVAEASDVTLVGTETLTIAAAQGEGITLQSGAPTTTLFTNIELAGDQAWTNDSANALTIAGTLVTSQDNHTLLVQGTGLTNIYAQIATGSGGLIKDGTGTAILYNNNTYSGGTTIKGGILAVDTAGALGLGNVINVSGTLQTTQDLGGVARTIYVASNFEQMAGGTLLLQVVSSPSADPSFDTGTPGTNYENLVVAGAAKLGGTLDLNFAPSTVVTPGQRYIAVTAGDPLTGHFIISTTTNLPQPYYTITTGNDTFNGSMPANSAIVTLMKPFTSFTGLNPNQTNVAEAVDKDLMDLNNGGYFALPNGTAAGDFFDNIVTGLNASIPQGGQLARTLDQLSPQRLELFRSVSFNNSSFFSQQVSSHTANERAGLNGLDTSNFGFNDSTLGSLSQVKNRLMAWQPTATPGLLSDSSTPLFDSLTLENSSTPAQPWNTFIAGNVILADINSTANVQNSNYTTGAVTAGADYRLSKNLTVGALFGYSHTDASLDLEGSTATIDSYTPGVYASYSDKGWYANGLFDYTYNGYTENRNIIFPGVNRTATGAPQGNQYNGDLSGGYEFHLGHWTLGPSAGLDYVHLDIHSFTENGAGAANLQVQEQSADSLRSRLGFESRYNVKYMKTDYGYHLGAYWQHEFMGNSTGISSSFQVPTSTAFTVYGPNPDRNTLLLDAGGDVQVLRNMDLFIDYSVQASQNQYFGQSIQGGVKVGF